MGRATDPGENHDPGKGQFYTQLDAGAPIRERPRARRAVPAAEAERLLSVPKAVRASSIARNSPQVGRGRGGACSMAGLPGVNPAARHQSARPGPAQAPAAAASGEVVDGVNGSARGGSRNRFRRCTASGGVHGVLVATLVFLTQLGRRGSA
jgi:hypothetical protein